MPLNSADKAVSLQPGDEIAHFTTTTIDGRVFDYRDAWQRKNLVLIALPETPSPDLPSRVSDWTRSAISSSGDDVDWVITHEPVAGVGRPGVVVTDKWGEVHLAQAAATLADLPNGNELVEWLEFVRHQCPECQGEAK